MKIVIGLTSAIASSFAIQQSSAVTTTSDCSFPCLTVYDPVCGSDGETYLNDCILSRAACESQKNITKVTDGACFSTPPSCSTNAERTCPEGCTKIYSPVCGSDGITYSNDCILGVTQCKTGNAIFKVSDGECPGTSPSSATDSGTRCPTVCIQIYKPVCGSNGVTYSNSCYLGIARCNNPSITMKKDGVCEESKQVQKPTAISSVT